MDKIDNLDTLKKNIIKALQKTMGIVTTAIENVKCSRATYYNYLRDDPEFKKQVDDIQNRALDFVESKMYKQIQEDNSSMIMFYMKTKGAKRGYSETQNINHSGTMTNINVNVKDEETKQNIDQLKNV